MYGYLLLLTICSTAGLHVWRTLFDNFAVNVVGLDGFHIGFIQSVRELPGFLSLLVVYVLLIVKEHRLSALSVLILGIGVALTGLMPSFYGLIFTTLVMSFGFHYFETTNQSLTLQYFDKQTSPVVFGKLRSFAAATNVICGLVVIVLAPHLEYHQLYMLFGITISIASAYVRADKKGDHIVEQEKDGDFRNGKIELFHQQKHRKGDKDLSPGSRHEGQAVEQPIASSEDHFLALTREFGVTGISSQGPGGCDCNGDTKKHVELVVFKMGG